MKVFCRNCGVHFPIDFKETLGPKCNFWGDRGLGNLPFELKEKVWFWLTSMPADEIFGKTGVDIAVSFKGIPADQRNTFEKTVPNWGILTEKQRQTYQKIYFKATGMKVKITHKEIMDKVLKIKEEVVN